jgi:ABC-2 type transport system ATP-binding protein
LPTDCDDVIDVRHLAKTYGRVRALADLSLRVRAGEVFGFLGPNGAGKTTAVKILAGLARPSCGSGSVLGRPLRDRRARTRLGYLPELFRYPDWLSAREVLRFHARICGRPVETPEIERCLDLVGLAPRANDRVGTFSKGMQQRLGLAVALLGRPDLIVLDEPTSALDPAGRLEVREILRDLREQGTTVFLNSHLLTEVEHVCDRIAILTKGRVAAQGSIAQVLGERHAVRIRARANGVALQPLLAAYGTVSIESTGSLRVEGVAADRVPEIVSALVAADAEVYAVEPISATLEERFLELTSERGR